MPDSAEKTKGPFRAGFLIHDASRLRRTVVDQRLKPLGVTRSQWWVLVNLARSEATTHKDGIAQVELARLLDVGKVTVTGLIDRLEESGLVQRIPDPNDRRSKLVKMSRKGRLLQEKLESVGAEINRQIMDSISEDEERQLIDILAKMKTNLRAMDAVPAALALVKPAKQSRHSQPA